MTELLERLGTLIPHGKIRTTTVGTLEDAGFPVSLACPPPHHVTIHLPDDPTDADFVRLADQLEPPVVRPDKEPAAFSAGFHAEA